MNSELNYYYTIKKVTTPGYISFFKKSIDIKYFKITLVLRIFTTLVTKLVRVLTMWLKVTCAIDMFTQLYEEYQLGGYR